METENVSTAIPAARNFFKAVTLLVVLFLLVASLDLLFYFPAKLLHLSSFNPLVSNALALLILIFVIKPKARLYKDYFNAKIPIQLYFFIVLISILLMIITLPLISMLPVIYDTKSDLKGTNTSFLIIYGSLIIPILEEIFFRGIILDDFLRIYSFKKAIIYSSLLFAVVHINPAMIVSAFLGGLIMGWLYYKTKTLIPCILLHATTNALYGIINNYLSPNGAIFNNHSSLYIIFYIICLCCFVFILILAMNIKYFSLK
ncbi:MAG: CPBP family intramembrane metalloprotease [Bacteroidota bacterium]|nr:CPBP family intramembrane metalloprotease [Bacteroidota bacterium]